MAEDDNRVDRYDDVYIYKSAGQGFLFGTIFGAVRYFKQAGGAPDALSIPPSVHTERVAHAAMRGSIVFSAIAGIYTATYQILAKERNKKDIYNHLSGGALAGAVASGILGDFSFKTVSKRIIGISLFAALYSRAIRIEDEAAKYRTKYGREMTQAELLSSFVEIDEE